MDSKMDILKREKTFQEQAEVYIETEEMRDIGELSEKDDINSEETELSGWEIVDNIPKEKNSDVVELTKKAEARKKMLDEMNKLNYSVQFKYITDKLETADNWKDKRMILKEYSRFSKKKNQERTEYFNEHEMYRMNRAKLKFYGSLYPIGKEKEKKDAELVDKVERFSESFVKWKKILDDGKATCKRVRDVRLLRMYNIYKGMFYLFDKIKGSAKYAPVVDDVMKEIASLKEVEDYLKLPEAEQTKKSIGRYSEKDEKDYSKYVERKRKLKERCGISLQDNEHELKEENDNTLSEVQLEGISEIDQWIVRNSGKANVAFVSQILSLKAKEKLYVYYCVQNVKGYAGNEKDAEISKEFVPDINAFKDKMIASKFKFWKRYRGHHIYWDKLGKALQSIQPLRAVINDDTDPVEYEEERYRESEEHKEKEREEIIQLEKEAKAEKDEEKQSLLVKKLNIKNSILRQEESYDKLKFLLSYQHKLLEQKGRNNLGVDLNIENNSKEIEACIEELDDEVKRYTKMMKGTDPIEIIGLVGAISKGVGDGVGTGVGMLASMSTNPMVASVKQIGLAQALGEGVEKYESVVKKINAFRMTKGAFGSVSVIGSMLSTVALAGEVCRTWSDVDSYEKALNTLEVAKKLNSTVSGALDVANTFSTVAKQMNAESFLEAAVNGTTTTAIDVASKAVSGVSAGLKILTGGVQFVQALSRNSDINDAISKFRSDNTSFDDTKSDTLEERAVRLSQRAKNRLFLKSAFNLAEGVLTPFGLDVVVFGLQMGVDYFVDKYTTKATIDDFVNLSPMLQQMDEEEILSYKGIEQFNKREELKKTFDDRLAVLRKECIGQSGFASKSEFLQYSLETQGQQVLDKIFKDKDGNWISPDSEQWAEHQKEAAPYIDIVKSFGLNVKFGNNLENCRPTLEMLRARLH